MPTIPAGLVPWWSWIKWGALALALIVAASIAGSMVNNHWKDKWLLRDAADLKVEIANAKENAKINADWAQKFADISTNSTKQQKARDAQYEADLAAYRSGAVKLRKQFTCYRNMSKDAASGRAIDGAGNCGLSDADVEFLVHFGKEANRLRDKVNNLQGVIKSVDDGLKQKR